MNSEEQVVLTIVFSPQSGEFRMSAPPSDAPVIALIGMLEIIKAQLVARQTTQVRPLKNTPSVPLIRMADGSVPPPW
jgi:hypothetical protein